MPEKSCEGCGSSDCPECTLEPERRSLQPRAPRAALTLAIGKWGAASEHLFRARLAMEQAPDLDSADRARDDAERCAKARGHAHVALLDAIEAFEREAFGLGVKMSGAGQ